MARPRNNPKAKRTHVNLTIDADVLADAREVLMGNGISISDTVSNLLALEVQKIKKVHAEMEENARIAEEVEKELAEERLKQKREAEMKKQTGTLTKKSGK